MRPELKLQLEARRKEFWAKVKEQKRLENDRQRENRKKTKKTSRGNAGT